MISFEVTPSATALKLGIIRCRNTGNAKAWQGKNMVAGETIILYLDEGKSVVERSKEEGERVKALIYPASEPAEPKQ